MDAGDVACVLAAGAMSIHEEIEWYEDWLLETVVYEPRIFPWQDFFYGWFV